MLISEFNPYWLIPIIFFARVVDVSLGTFRFIMVIRGHRMVATAVGFIESMVWITAVGGVIANLDQWYLIVAYAAGYATGNWVGIWLESRAAIGTELVRAISKNSENLLAETLRQAGYRPVRLAGSTGNANPVEVILVVVRRRKVPELVQIIHEADPEAVYTVSDIKTVHDSDPALQSSYKSMSWARKAFRK
jgi:uncharacterized protein YebE (UPF0316 family)